MMSRMNRTSVIAGILLVMSVACGSNTVEPTDVATSDVAVDTGAPDTGSTLPKGAQVLPAEPQRDGDPALGYTQLVNEGYVHCGMPYWVFKMAMGAQDFGPELPGREGLNVGLPFMFNAFTTESGVDVVAPTCLSCHAGVINGQLVVGLGNALQDFTMDTTGPAQMAGGLLTDPKEIAEWAKWNERVQAIGPYIKTLTVGVNPADNLAAALFAHRDPETLAWSSEPLREMPPTHVVPVDVPPWWRMKKKTTMFYTAAGRGDHARIMMTASTLCTDTVEEAAAIDAYFPNIRSYIESIEPPAYPHPVDEALAESGKEVFEAVCSGCHGTYGPEGVYPNLIIATDEVGTDPLLATGASQFADTYVDWFNDSFYGEIARLEPVHGYVPPPLDGIWATPPFFHNGSVPTIELVLDSTKRPKYWTWSFDPSDYDTDALGWNYTFSLIGHDLESDPGKRKLIYDTTKSGYGKAGHTYGDALSPEERAAVIEYLKTL